MLNGFPAKRLSSWRDPAGGIRMAQRENPLSATRIAGSSKQAILSRVSFIWNFETRDKIEGRGDEGSFSFKGSRGYFLFGFFTSSLQADF
jgi:hypothetical protein